MSVVMWAATVADLEISFDDVWRSNSDGACVRAFGARQRESAFANSQVVDHERIAFLNNGNS